MSSHSGSKNNRAVEANTKQKHYVLAACFFLIACFAYSLTMKMEAASFSETLMNFIQTLWHNIPQVINVRTSNSVPCSVLIIFLLSQIWILFQLPVIAYLRNPSFKQRHWMQIEQVLNYKFEPDVVITLELLERIGVFSYGLEMQEISSQASSEAALEVLLKKVVSSFITLLRVVTRVKTVGLR